MHCQSALGKLAQDRLGRSCSPQREEKGETEAGEAGFAGILWIHEFWKSELLLLQRQVLSSCLGVHGLSKPRRDGRLGMCWRGVLRKSAHPPCFSSLWPEQALSCLKHWIMWQGKGTKKGKAGIWFGSYHLSGLGCYRSLMSWTWAKAVFAGDFLQPQGLILKAGPDTGQGLWLLWLRWGSMLRPPHFTKQKLNISLKLGLEGEMVNHSRLQLTKQ